MSHFRSFGVFVKFIKNYKAGKKSQQEDRTENWEKIVEIVTRILELYRPEIWPLFQITGDLSALCTDLNVSKLEEVKREIDDLR